MTKIRIAVFTTLVLLGAQACSGNSDSTDTGAPDASPDTAPETGVDGTTMPPGDAASDAPGNADAPMDIASPSGDAVAGDAPADTAADAAASEVATIQPTCTMAVAKAYEPFDGSTLGAHWNQTAIGTAPTFTVSGGRLQITDAAFAATPSMATNSWIYDSDTDLANQMTWDQTIGTGDFELLFDAGSASSLAQLTLAGIALTDAAGHLEAFAGAWDGDASTPDAFGVFIRKPGIPDASANLRPANFAKVAIIIRRVAGQMTIAIDGKVAVTGANAADIKKLSIVTVRHKNAAMDFEFGTAELDEVTLCY